MHRGSASWVKSSSIIRPVSMTRKCSLSLLSLAVSAPRHYSALATPRQINGKAISAEILKEVHQELRQLSGQSTPHLVVLTVAPNLAIKSYMKKKQEACGEVGFKSTIDELPDNVDTLQLIDRIAQHNENPLVDGIILQLPVPRHIDVNLAISAISPDKDADGLHPQNLGQLMMGRTKGLVPCTPAGVVELLRRADVRTDGKNCVIVGRSNLVGKPLANLLLAQEWRGTGGPSVTVLHAASKEVRKHTREADILVTAVGKAGLIGVEDVKPGAVIIDVGINHIPDSSARSGFRLRGDVVPEALLHSSMYTPVPGGVGPMTVAMLIRNTLRAHKQRLQNQR